MQATDLHKGKLISQYAHNRVRDEQYLSVGGIGVIVFIVAMFAFAYFDVTAEELGYGFILILGLAFLVLPILSAVGAYRIWMRPAVDIYEQGLQYSDRLNQRFIAWTDIDDIRSIHSPDSQIGKYGLYADNKRLLVINDRFQRGADLVSQLLAEIYKNKDYQARFDTGETLTAGKLSINRDGLQIGNEVIKWERIRGAQQQGHMTLLVIHYDDRKINRISISNLPNAPVLVYLLGLELQKRLASPPATVLEDSSANIDAETKTDTPVIDANQEYETCIFKRKQVLQIIMVLIVLAGAAFIIVSTIRTAIEWNYTSLEWVFSGLLASIIPLLALAQLSTNIRNLRNKTRYVLNKDGFTVATPTSKTQYQWHELDYALFNRFYMFVAYQVTTKAGEHFIIDGRYISHLNFGAVIEHLHANQVFESYQKRFELGEKLNFGALEIDQLGVYFANRSPTWHDIKSYDYTQVNNEPHVVIYGENQKRLFAVSLFRIKNPYILKLLLHNQLNPQAHKVTTIDDEF